MRKQRNEGIAMSETCENCKFSKPSQEWGDVKVVCFVMGGFDLLRDKMGKCDGWTNKNE